MTGILNLIFHLHFRQSNRALHEANTYTEDMKFDYILKNQLTANRFLGFALIIFIYFTPMEYV